MAEALNCPNCGAALKLRVQTSRVVVCEYCNGSIAIEADKPRHTGDVAALIDEPSLLHLYAYFACKDLSFRPFGKIQLSYAGGVGLWEEWWCRFEDGSFGWVSVDEGDIVVQTVTSSAHGVNWADVRLGEHISIGEYQCQITEVDVAKVESMAGELPDLVEVGSTFNYAHAETEEGQLITLEQREQGVEIYIGEWLDPYEVRRK